MQRSNHDGAMNEPVIGPWDRLAPGPWRVALVFTLTLAFLSAGNLACGGSTPEPEEPKNHTTEPSDDSDRSGFRRATSPGMDDDDDDGLQIEGLRGRLDTYDIQEGMRPHTRELERCYSSKLNRRRYLGGDVELAFVVDRDGTVKSAIMSQSNLGVWAMEKCMLEVCRDMTFPKPKGGAEAEFSVPLSFTARSPVKDWNDARTETEVAELTAELDACAEESGTEAPGDLRITLYVATRGQVKSVGFSRASGDVPVPWADCAEAKISAWTLSDPLGRVTRASFVYNAQ